MRIERSGAFNVKWNYILKHRCKKSRLSLK